MEQQEQWNEQNESGDLEIDLGSIFRELLKHVWMIVFVGVVCGLIAFFVSSNFITPQYVSKASVYVLNRSTNDTLNSSDIATSTALTNDFIALVGSHFVLDQVLENMGLTETVSFAELKSMMSVSVEGDSRIITIAISHPEPAMAKQLVDGIVEVVVSSLGERVKIEVNCIDDGSLPTAPSSPNVKLYTILGLAAGLFVAVAIVVISFLLDDTLKDEQDVERYLGLMVLANIPLEDSKADETFSRKIKGMGKRGKK